MVGDPEHPNALDGLEKVRNEYVVRIGGTLRRRKDPNPRLPTGNLELVAEKVGPAVRASARVIPDGSGVGWVSLWEELESGANSP